MHRKATNKIPATTPASPEVVANAAVLPGNVSIFQLFSTFLLIGATSFGGGAVAYLRNSLVDKHEWLDDRSFVECCLSVRVCLA